MAKPRLEVPLDRFLKSSASLERVLQGSAALDPAVRKLVAELVVLRLFDEFQSAIKGAAVRLACGCRYLDGAAPRLLASPANTTGVAESAFRTHGRAKETSLSWSKAGYIVDSVKFVLDPTDDFCTTIQNHGGTIAEIVAVRNRIAHNNAASRAKYRTIVKRHYGSELNSVTPGTLLVSPRFSPTKSDLYIRSLRTIVRACVKG